MGSDYDDNLLRQAIINIKARDFSMARRYLELALNLADDHETRTQANYWLSQISSDPLEKRHYLEETLAADPLHPEARKALAILDGKLKPDELVNPDKLPSQTAGSQEVHADRFTCPRCGGRMVFDGDGHTLICEYCSREKQPAGTAPQVEQDFLSAMATAKGHRSPMAMRTFNCQGCGARFILNPREISAICAFCGSPHVVAEDRELIQPDSIIPMEFNQSRALTCLEDWLEKHQLKLEERMKDLQGMYLPAWSFELLGQVPWDGTVYRNKQRVPVSGAQNISFDQISVPGVRRLADLLVRILPGYDLNAARAYDPVFLSGWPAEVYELSMSDASLEAREQVVAHALTRIQAEAGHVNDLHYSTAGLSILSFHLILIPLWFTTYSLEGRDFRVVINGQTGKVYGETHRHGIFGWMEEAFGE